MIAHSDFGALDRLVTPLVFISPSGEREGGLPSPKRCVRPGVPGRGHLDCEQRSPHYHRYLNICLTPLNVEEAMTGRRPSRNIRNRVVRGHSHFVAAFRTMQVCLTFATTLTSSAPRAALRTMLGPLKAWHCRECSASNPRGSPGSREPNSEL